MIVNNIIDTTMFLQENIDILTTHIPIQPLIFDATLDTSNIQQVLLIDSNVPDFQQYANTNTFPIVYNRTNTKEQMIEILSSKFQNISRIAIVSHFSEEPYFLNNELLFSDANTQFMIDIIKQFNVLHIDYLACNTLQSLVWKDYYSKLRDATGIPIGASDDNTGNLKYGGDWIMETTQEDIQTIYFNDTIQNYASLLALNAISQLSVFALNNIALIIYGYLTGTPSFLKTQYSIDNSPPWNDCIAAGNESSIITGLTNDISYSGYYIRAIDSAGNAGTSVLIPTFTPKTAASYVATSNFRFIYKMSTIVWNNNTGVKTPPFISTGSFGGLSLLSILLVDSDENTQVTYAWTSFSDNGNTNDGINCSKQKFNGLETFSSISSFVIIQFGGMPLSRSTTAPTMSNGIFADFRGKILATDTPKILPNTNLSHAFNNSRIVANNFGNIKSWDTTNVTSMSNMFNATTNFNYTHYIGGWNTSSVKDMSSMFEKSKFNQSIGGWNTSSVTNMDSMFSGNISFIQNIGGWDTTSVKNMSSMFYGATGFNQNIGMWNTSLVTSMTYMFNGATRFNNGNNAFYWNTEKVSLMNYMFNGASVFNQHIGTFDTRLVTSPNSQSMFTGTAFSNDSTNKPRAILTNGTRLTYAELRDPIGIYKYTLNELTRISPIIITNVLALDSKVIITYKELLYLKLLTLKIQYSIDNSPPWNDCNSSSTNTSIITGLYNDISYSTYYIRAIDSDGNYGTSVLVPTFVSRTTASYETTKKFIYKINTFVWNNAGVKTYPFKTTPLFWTDLSYSTSLVDSGTNTQVTCTWTSFSDNGTTDDGINCATQKLNTVAFSLIPSFEITQFGGMHLSRSIVEPTTTTGLFVNFTGKISATDVPKILSNTNLGYAFYSSSASTLPNANYGILALWDTMNVTNMSFMFHNNTFFNQNIGIWNTSSVKNMSTMFSYATNFNQNIGGWDTSLVTTMNEMFQSAINFNQNIGSWNTSNVLTMYYMFSIATLFNNGAFKGVLDPVNNAFYWNTGKVANMIGMFQNATSFNQHIGTFDTRLVSSANATNMFTSATAFITDALTNTPKLIFTNGTRLTYQELIDSSYNYNVKELIASDPTSVYYSEVLIDTNFIINKIYFTNPSYLGVTSIINYKYSIDNGTNWVICNPPVTNSPINVTIPSYSGITIKLKSINLIPNLIPKIKDASSNLVGTVFDSSLNTTTKGKILATDIDLSGNFRWDLSGSPIKPGTYGTMSIDNSGNWTYDLSKNSVAYTALQNDASANDAFTVYVYDDLSANAYTTINITVVGKSVTINNIPKIIDASSNLVGTVSDSSSNATAKGTIVATDVDLSGNFRWDLSGSETQPGTYGTMKIDNSGNWTYDLSTNSVAYKALKKDASANDAFTAYVYDDLSANAYTTINITVFGINDPPKIIDTSSNLTGTVSDSSSNATGKIFATDVDVIGNFRWDLSGSQTKTSNYGTMTIDNSGNWTYDLSTNSVYYNALNKDSSANDEFTAYVYDDLFASDFKTINIKIIGQNKTPVIKGDTSGNVWEDGSLNATGTLTALDEDLIGNFKWDVSGGKYGTIGISYSGSKNNTATWTYDLCNNKIQFLSGGQTIVDTFNITVLDDINQNAIQSINITIIGKNDPVNILNLIPNQSTDLSSNFSYVIPSNTFLDIDMSDNLSYTVFLNGNSALPDWLLFDSPTRTFTSTSDQTKIRTVGPLSIKVTATDGITSSSVKFIITVFSEQTISGTVLDGYIKNGTITVRDLSNNIIAGPIQTDTKGNYSLPIPLNPLTTYIIDCSGGIDIATGNPILYTLSAIYTSGTSTNIMLNASNIIVTPLTTIVTDIVKIYPDLYKNNISQVYDIVANAFGLQPKMMYVDYIYTQNILPGIAAVKIATITNLLSSATSTDINSIKSSIATYILTQTVPIIFDTSFISDIVSKIQPNPMITDTLKTNVTNIIASVSNLMDSVINVGSAIDINRITKQYKELYKYSKGAISIDFNSLSASIMTSTETTTMLTTLATTQSIGNITPDNLLVANICFIKGTNVVTDQGIIEIQNISLANTINGKKILMTTKTRNVDDYIVLIKKDALSKNVPNEDTCLTGEHCVLYNRKMVKSKNLINGSSVQKLNMERQEVYNLLLEGETSGDMIANNLIAETLDPKSIFVKILKTVKSQNYSPEEEAKCIQDLNKDLKIAHEKKMEQMKLMRKT